MTGGDDHLSALWLATIQRVVERAGHDFRNTLNGVAVNVEVVRSRAARGADATAIAPFATAAAGQVETLTAQADALVAILRPTTLPVDLGALLVRLVNLLRLGSGKGQIDLELPVSQGAIVSTAGGDATRLALAAGLLAALEGGGRVLCRLGTDSPPTVYIASVDGPQQTLAQDIVDAVRRAGILLSTSPNGITVTFPSNLMV